ncbi:MAG: shikimate dehydrogenase, partial [Alphaproteobacteria bacterium]
AVYTIVLKDGKRYGDNSDCTGFKDSFRQNIKNAALDNVRLIGAGGAGGAIAQALLDNEVKRLCIYDIDWKSAAALVQRLVE